MCLGSTFSNCSEVRSTQIQNNGKRERTIDYGICPLDNDCYREAVCAKTSFWNVNLMEGMNKSDHKPMLMEIVCGSTVLINSVDMELEHARWAFFVLALLQGVGSQPGANSSSRSVSHTSLPNELS